MAAILARAMGGGDRAARLYDSPVGLGAAMALRDIGLPFAGLRPVAQTVTQSGY
ncbi:MAG: hypothetical protein P4M00_12485 [Azospirillaceae bacterium]|nr:hypothetical protein [Azospirillaceae bacterium]